MYGCEETIVMAVIMHSRRKVLIIILINTANEIINCPDSLTPTTIKNNLYTTVITYYKRIVQ